MNRTAVIDSTGYTGPVGREIVTAATVPLLTVSAVRERLRLPFSDEDGDLQAFIEAATTEVEEHLGRRLLPQTWRWWYDSVPTGRVIVLPEPVRSITAIKSYATDDDATGTTLTSTEYTVDARRHRIVIDDDSASWPPTSVRDYNAVSIEAVVGYAEPDDVPASVLLATHLVVQGYYLRGAETPADSDARHAAVSRLLAPWRFRMGVA